MRLKSEGVILREDTFLKRSGRAWTIQSAVMTFHVALGSREMALG